MMDREQLAALVDDALDATERQRIEDLLAQDTAAADEVLGQLRMGALLRSLLTTEARRRALARSVMTALAAPPLEQVQSRVLRDVAGSNRLAWWRRRAIAWAVGATAAAACLLALVQFLKPAPMQPVIASTQLHLAEIAGEARVVRAAQTLPARRDMELLNGDVLQLSAKARATVLLADRSRCELTDAAELLIRSADGRQLELARGRMQVAAQKQPAGDPLTIRTALANLRVLGTVFAVQSAERQTRLDVNEGLVRVDHARQDSAVEVAAGEFAVVVPQGEIFAGVKQAAAGAPQAGGRELALHPFRADSPWNQPIGRTAKYADVQSAALDLAEHGASVAPAAHMRPLWVAAAGAPVRRIVSRYEDRVLATLPAPDIGARTVNGTLLDPEHALAYELVQAAQRGEDIEVQECLTHDLRGSGVPPEQCGRTFSGLPLVAGLIRSGELEQGIRHALAASALHEGLNRNAGAGQPFVWPARHMPIELHKLKRLGTTGNVCYGTRLAIPRNVDVTTLGLGAPALAIAHALQDYGAFVTHSFARVPQNGPGGWKQPHLQFFADEPMDGPDWQQLAAEVSKLAAQLKVITP